MAKRRLYSRELKSKSDNATTFLLKGDLVEPGWILYITTGSVEDETTAPTTLAFGKLKDSLFIPLEEDAAPLAGKSYHIDKTHHFIAGERPAFRVEGSTLNDVISGYLEGYYEAV